MGVFEVSRIHFTFQLLLKYRSRILYFTMKTKNAVSALAALAQESRLTVFRLLVQAGPQGMAASKISEKVGVSPSSLSFHLKEMVHADLVASRQEGRFVIYTANFKTMNALLQFLTKNCCGGNPCTTVCKTDAMQSVRP